MGRTFAGSSDIYIDEFDFSGVINAVTIDIDNPIADITAFEDTDQTFVEGKPSFTITLNGLYSTASPNYDGEMFTDLTSSDRLITISPSIAAATGGIAYFGQGDITSMPITSDIAAAVLLNITWNGNKPIVRGRFGYVDATLGSTGDGTAYQLGAITSSYQIIMFQHVLSVAGTGTPTLTTTVYSDSLEAFNDAPLLIATFAGATAVTSERKVRTTVDVDTWYRPTFSITGTDPAFSVIFAFGRAPYNA